MLLITLTLFSFISYTGHFINFRVDGIEGLVLLNPEGFCTEPFFKKFYRDSCKSVFVILIISISLHEHHIFRTACQVKYSLDSLK